MKTLNNPVVLLGLGSCHEFLPFLSDAISDYMSGVGFIKVPQDFDEDFIKKEVKRIWQEFLGVYKADILRANFLINADDTALNLPDLIVAAEKFFSPLYPAGILGDVYCLFDDSNLTDETRKSAIAMLDEIKGEGLNIYLLSNLTSTASFIQKETIAQTMAMLTLFKNSSQSLNVAEADASRYSEMFFLKNCAARNGDFLTAGSVKLNIPQDALKSLLMAEILKYDIQNQPPQLKTPEFPPKHPTKTMEYLYGIAIPDANYADPLTRGQWIKRCFGLKLDSLDNDWDEADFKEENIAPQATSIYDLLRCTSEGGFFEKTARENTENAIAVLHSEEEKCKNWLAKPPERDEYITRRLSPLKSQELLPYNIAHEYLRKQNDIKHIKDKIKIMERQRRKISVYHKKLCRYESEINKTISEQEKKAEEINKMFEGFCNNALSYFQEKFISYATSHKTQIEDLHREMMEYFDKNDFSGFKKRLMDFIEKNIITSQEFSRPIMEILQELIGDEPPAEALSEWVAQNNHLGIRLKTGYAKLHTEANLYVPSAQAFETKKCYEQRGQGRMNLFSIENASESHVSALYHAGAFNLDELYW
ncbi:MAG: hypothetical protein FWF78_09630 [Defluviitaleaceae bacterium]|nr:hypothetical protein [Defluviitaleaceae bacterium]